MCVCVHTYASHFLHSTVSGHLGCFYDLAVVISDVMNLGGSYVFFKLQFSLDICPGVGLQDHMVALFLVFKGTSILFSTEAAPIYIPTNSARGFSFSTPSPAFVICGIFNDGHSDSCQMVLR